MEAGQSKAQNHLQLHSNLEASLGYMRLSVWKKVYYYCSHITKIDGKSKIQVVNSQWTKCLKKKKGRSEAGGFLWVWASFPHYVAQASWNSLSRLGWPQTQSDPSSISLVLGSQMCATMPGCFHPFWHPCKMILVCNVFHRQTRFICGSVPTGGQTTVEAPSSIFSPWTGGWVCFCFSF